MHGKPNSETINFLYVLFCILFLGCDRNYIHNSEDTFTSADMFASWVRVRSKRNGPLSWMRVPWIGGGEGIEKVGSRRFLQETPPVN